MKIHLLIQPMKSSRFFFGVLLASSLLASSLHAENLLPQGNFSTGELGGLPDKWIGHQAAHLTRVSGSHDLVSDGTETFLRLQKQNESGVLKVESSQSIPKGTKAVTLRITDRVIDIIPGSENPNRNVFRVGVSFEDASKQKIQDATPQIARHKSFLQWKTESLTYEVPEGTENISISLTMLNCTGTWEIQLVELTAE